MRKNIFRVFTYIFLFLLVLSPTPAHAQPEAWSTDTSSGHACVVQGDVATIKGFECLFFNILQVIVFIAGIAAFFMFIVGGFKYIFSENDPKKTAAAASTLTMAIVGIVGVIASWLILKLISDFTGINVLDFVIPGWKI